MDDDPDALWKPGYRGGFRTPERADVAKSARSGRRPPLAVAVAALVLVAATVGLLTGVLRSERDAESDGADVPVDVAVALDRWSVTFDTTRFGAVTATDELVVAVVDRPGSVVALDRRDGAERWRRSAPGASATGLDVVDDAVLVRHVEADGRGSAAAFDATSGAPLWARPLSVGETIDVVGAAAIRRDRAGAERIDPRTGEPAPLSSVGTAAGPTDNVVRGLAPDARLLVEIDDAVLTVVLDATTVSVVLTYEPHVRAVSTREQPDP